MSNRILVTYATRMGSTVGVADAIGNTLSENGLQVDVRPMDMVASITPYQAVVAGSAIHEKRWLPEALFFVKTHRAVLAQKPFAAFLVCMTLAMHPDDQQDAVSNWLAPVRALVQPASEGIFAGVMDVDKLTSVRDRLLFRANVGTGSLTEGDHRDWNAIRAWANALPAKLNL